MRNKIMALVAGVAVALVAYIGKSEARQYAWDPSVQFEDGSAITSPVTYRVYQMVGTNMQLIGTSATTNFTWKPASGIYTVVVTAVVAGYEESDPSVALQDDARKPGKPSNVRKAQ